MSSIDLNDFNELPDEQNFDQDFDINEFQAKPLNDQNLNLSKNEKSKNEDISFNENDFNIDELNLDEFMDGENKNDSLFKEWNQEK